MNLLTLMGKLLTFIGLMLIFFGLLLLLFSRMKNFAPLPGDIYIQKKNFIFYFPIVTSLLISFLFSVIIWLLVRR